LFSFLEILDNFSETVSRYILNRSMRMNGAESLRRALELVQEREDQLSDEEMAAFMDVFRSEPTFAEAYLALEDHDGLRKGMIRQLLSKQEACQ
jgi:hypothetical protein